LKDLGTDYVDLYLVDYCFIELPIIKHFSDLSGKQIHWPQSYEKQTPYTLFPEDGNGNPLVTNVPIASTWQAMEALVTAGKAKSIGVSNFSQAQLEELITT